MGHKQPQLLSKFDDKLINVNQFYTFNLNKLFKELTDEEKKRKNICNYPTDVASHELKMETKHVLNKLKKRKVKRDYTNYTVY